LRGIYAFLKQGWDDVSVDVNPLAFTAQEALWNARSEFSWKEAWKEREGRHLCVRVGEWDDVMTAVDGSELEELGIMLLAILKGIDGLRAVVRKEEWGRWGIDWKRRDGDIGGKRLVGINDGGEV